MKIQISGIKKNDLHLEENAYRISTDQEYGGWVYLFGDMSNAEIEWDGFKGNQIPLIFSRIQVQKICDEIVDELREFLWNNQDEKIFPDSFEMEV